MNLTDEQVTTSGLVELLWKQDLEYDEDSTVILWSAHEEGLKESFANLERFGAEEGVKPTKLVQSFGKNLYVISHNIKALDPVSGQILWESKDSIGKLDRGIYSDRPQVVAVDSLTIFALYGKYDDHKTLYEIDIVSGRIDAEVDLSELLNAAGKTKAVFAGDMKLFFDFEHGMLLAFDLIQKTPMYFRDEKIKSAIVNEYPNLRTLAHHFDAAQDPISPQGTVTLNDITLSFRDFDGDPDEGQFSLQPYGTIDLSLRKLPTALEKSTIYIPQELGLDSITRVGKDLYICSGDLVYKFNYPRSS